MQLNSLKIERQKWGRNEGQYVGVIKFDNEVGNVSIKLSEEKCKELFMVCADGIVETAKVAARELTCSVIEHKKSIEQDS
jgi:hypothetical protein